jgi:tetratricopeptide (TPR) repeat protein
MSPEQIRGAPTDARTDQFSFCVMLWELLHGERPFAGESLVELGANILQGRRLPPPRGVRVPAWLRAVIQRGLTVDASDRWPSLTALLQALDRGRRRARAYKAATGIGVLALAGAAPLIAQHVDEQRRVAACDDVGSEVNALWNEHERAAVRSALLATGAGHAADTADKLMPWLDAHASAWRTARTEACLAAEVHVLWDADRRDRAVWCLDERRLELGALVTELQNADVEAVSRAVPAAASLRGIEPCQDAVLLSRLPAPPNEARAEVQSLRAELARAGALEATGAYEDGLEIARTTLQRAEAVAWPPLTAAAAVQVGNLLDETGAYADAEAMEERAYFEAARGGALEEALSAAQRLVFVVGYRLARHADAERWSRHAEAIASALPDPANLRQAASLNALALVRYESGAYADAGSLHERALAITETALGPDNPVLATDLNNLATVREATGAYGEAAALHERALAIRQNALGPHHPLVATSLGNLAGVRAAMGSYEEAASLSEEAVTIFERALGPDHAELASTLNNLAATRYAMGAYDEAASLSERALSIEENALGPEHPSVATTLNNLGAQRHATGAYEEAARLHERALAIRHKVLGPEHPDVAESLNNLAAARQAAGGHKEAATLYERALAIWEQALGPEHPRVAASLANLGNLRLRSGAYDEAVPLYERALAISERALGPNHPFVAHPLVGLARISLARHRPADAVRLAERAVRVREAGNLPATEIAEAQRVLARALAGRDR